MMTDDDICYNNSSERDKASVCEYYGTDTHVFKVVSSGDTCLYAAVSGGEGCHAHLSHVRCKTYISLNTYICITELFFVLKSAV